MTDDDPDPSLPGLVVETCRAKYVPMTKMTSSNRTQISTNSDFDQSPRLLLRVWVDAVTSHQSLLMFLRFGQMQLMAEMMRGGTY